MSFREGDRTADRLTAQMERALAREYREALDVILAELGRLYGSLPMTPAQRLERRRLANLQFQIEQELTRLYRANRDTLLERLQELYRTMYYMTGWAIEKELGGAQLAWGLLNPDVIRAAVLAPIDRLTLDDRLERNRRRIVTAIRNNITQGLILGEAYEDMAKRIRGVLGQDARKARVVARTEGHRIRNQGKFQSAQRAAELGIQMVKVWDATLDMRTRPAHRRLDGVKVGVDEDFNSPAGGKGPAPGNLGRPEDDINCRCTFRLEIAGYPPAVRRTREGMTRYQTYEEWAQARGIQ